MSSNPISWGEAYDRKVAISHTFAATVEEFYNQHHQQSGKDGGEFVEGPDGPGRVRDKGKEDLGKPGVNQPKKAAPAKPAVKKAAAPAKPAAKKPAAPASEARCEASR